MGAGDRGERGGEPGRGGEGGGVAPEELRKRGTGGDTRRGAPGRGVWPPCSSCAFRDAFITKLGNRSIGSYLGGFLRVPYAPGTWGFFEVR